MALIKRNPSQNGSRRIFIRSLASGRPPIEQFQEWHKRSSEKQRTVDSFDHSVYSPSAEQRKRDAGHGDEDEQFKQSELKAIRRWSVVGHPQSSQFVYRSLGPGGGKGSGCWGIDWGCGIIGLGSSSVGRGVVRNVEGSCRLNTFSAGRSLTG